MDFLHTETFKQLKSEAKRLNIGGKGVSHTRFRGSYSSPFGELYDYSFVKATKTNKTIKSVKSDKLATSLVVKEICKNPYLIRKAVSAGAKEFLLATEKKLNANNINVNLVGIYNQPNSNLKRLVAMLKAGVVEIVNQPYSIVARSDIRASNKILLITANQAKSKEFKPITNEAGLFRGRLAITAFSVDNINALSIYNRNCSGNLYSYLINNYKIKAEKLDTNDLVDDFSVQTLSAEEIADGILNGCISRKEVVKSCNQEKINKINHLLTKKVVI